ncbi:immediate early response gene 5-like protein [Biomphalaria glabrata]|uniref:Immediate early response gene 5-like protein n=1 Tax=Biomphalaria glabrata TaxID=6526 RepID=A0A9U8EE89_BIOGL|nr:immediate early response gene 5-like protein [Biomphalaria glabrata]KAI8738681.1 immediate early response gene 5 protein [Biomphalaria glabrata]
MAATMETQRLISVSLGKIAQSRGQRGGINLHKNLLVATVLHKARTAYMMESFYQQRQKLSHGAAQQQQQPQQAPQNSAPVVVPLCTQGYSESPVKEEVCQTPRDSNLDQPRATPCASEETRSNASADTNIHEPMTVCDEVHDKENAPPSCASRLSHVSTDSSALDNSPSQTEAKPSLDHLSAATQLSYEARIAADDNSSYNNTTSASSTCNVLKRRRDNPSACYQDQEGECPVSKKARVSYDSCTHSALRDSYLSDFDISSDESDSEPELEMMHSTSDSPQITNLVSIFHSGFSGLCPIAPTHDSDSELESSGYQSDLDVSGSSQFTPLSKMRPESPSPAYSRKMSEPSLMCSSQMGRLGSLPSAIILSA